MSQKFIKSVLLGSLVAGTLVFGSFKANAAGFHEGIKNHGIAVSSSKFYEVLARTNTDHVGYNFGAPDEMQKLKDTAGNKVGTVWVYRDAVKKDNGMQDASIVIIKGELQYATLSDSI